MAGKKQYQKKKWPPSPVHKEGNYWWFWDETWSNKHGPFPSKEIASKACIEYARSL